MFGLFSQQPKIVSRATLFRYGVPQKINFEHEILENGYIIITSPDLPGFITQTKNIKNLPKVLSDAVLCYYDIPNEEGNLLQGDFNIGKMTYSFNPQAQTA